MSQYLEANSTGEFHRRGLPRENNLSPNFTVGVEHAGELNIWIAVVGVDRFVYG